MSKKWKNKLKKQQKAQLLREALGQTNTPAVSAAPAVRNVATPITAERSIEKPKFVKKEVVVESAGDEKLLPEVALVKHDVRKIAYIMGTILILLTTAAITDSKTGWILSFADLVFKRMH